MANESVINTTYHETRVALIENGTIAELYIERTKVKGIVGNIYKGQVRRILPGMQAAFIEIGSVSATIRSTSAIAVPVVAKIPAPMTAPTPSAVRSQRPITRLSPFPSAGTAAVS